MHANHTASARQQHLLLGDALYATYFLLCTLRERRIDAVFEQHGSRQRTTDFRRGQRLGQRSTTRSPALPEAPTMAEAALPDYDMPAWRSIMGPAGMRSDIVAALNAAIGRTLVMPDIIDRFRTAGSEPAPSSPEELGKRYADWVGRFGKIAKEAGIRPQ